MTLKFGIRFNKQAKLFGLSLDEIKELIDLRAEGVTPCKRLERIIKKHLDDLDRRIHDMVSNWTAGTND